ncbi:MAG: glycosyltransferase family 4 protein [Salinibacter sp.]|uniref:glycosyltransferase family 4 protein n=1 Tax=Salinibacter sp. TaxID=2065818 RepID=UPI0035D494CE
MSNPRVLFLDQAGVLGGAELCLLDVARAFRTTSRVVLFEDGPFRERLEDAGIPAEVYPAPPALLDVKKAAGWTSALRAVPGLVRLTAQVARAARDYDVIFANSQKAMLVAGLAGMMARRPVIWSLHDMLTAGHFSALNRRVAVTGANWLVDHVIANSRATQSAFRRGGGQVEKTTVVHNGIDAGPFEAVDSSDLEALREELDCSGAPLLGVFGRLAPWKGQHVVLEALTDLPDAHALLVGDTLFRGDEPYEETLRRTARHLNVADRVHFLGFRDDVPRLMTLVDLVLHTSVAPEPFGRVIVEGMLAGTPVIATRAGGPTEIVREPDTGVLVPPDDPQALATAVEDLLSAPDRTRSMGRAAQAYARRHFSLDRMRRGVERVISEVCRDPR